MSGRGKPRIAAITSWASTTCPSALASDWNRSQNPAKSTSPRSNLAQALLSGLVELIRRTKPSGRPRSSSYWANPSKGPVVRTPPISNSTALITGRVPARRLRVSGSRPHKVSDAWAATGEERLGAQQGIAGTERCGRLEVSRPLLQQGPQEYEASRGGLVSTLLRCAGPSGFWRDWASSPFLARF